MSNTEHKSYACTLTYVPCKILLQQFSLGTRPHKSRMHMSKLWLRMVRPLPDQPDQFQRLYHLEKIKLLVERSFSELKVAAKIAVFIQGWLCIHKHTRSFHRWPRKEANSELNLSSSSYSHSYLINIFDFNVSCIINKEFHWVQITFFSCHVQGSLLKKRK